MGTCTSRAWVIPGDIHSLKAGAIPGDAHVWGLVQVLGTPVHGQVLEDIYMLRALASHVDTKT